MLLVGPYAFQLSGTTTISGTPKTDCQLRPHCLGWKRQYEWDRIRNFSGLLLGNPVTGTYEAKWDCSIVGNCKTIPGPSSISRNVFA